MKTLYTLFIFSLLILIGCDKHDPEPPLTGRWDWVQSKTTHFRADGSLWYEESASPATQDSHYLLITADSMNEHHQTTGILRETYTRSGNTLNVKSSVGRTPYTLAIMELTDRRLRVRFEQLYGGLPYMHTDTEYSRR